MFVVLIEDERNQKTEGGREAEGRKEKKWEVVAPERQTPEKRLEARPPAAPSRAHHADQTEAAPARSHSRWVRPARFMKRDLLFFSTAH